MRDKTVKVILAQSLVRLALQEVTALKGISTARESLEIDTLQRELHRSFVTLSSLMDKAVTREQAEDA